jgi:phosphohistidine phosphatase SixA
MTVRPSTLMAACIAAHVGWAFAQAQTPGAAHAHGPHGLHAAPAAMAGNPHGHASPLHAPAPVYLLAERLRQGGLVLFLRHGKTAHDGIDQPQAALDDCTRQCNLSPAGRALSQEMGDAFKTVGIPVGSVLASPWCRAMDTARLAFGAVQAEPGLAVDLARTGDAVARFRELSSRAPAAGTNTVLVGHLLPPLMALGMKVDEGEAIVMRPGPDAPVILGRINAVQWGDLARDWRAYGDKVFGHARSEQHTPPGQGAHPPHGRPQRP